jgi:uncharacterized protein (DUF488 family)
MEERREIFTIGHSTHPTERFVGLLRPLGVAVVADVRRYPVSRRNPQFNADAFSASLAAAAIDYVPLGEELGGRRSLSGPRLQPRATPSEAAGANAAFAAYAAYMTSDQFASGLQRLEEIGRERRTAIMCAEGDWRRCHRSLISEALAATGWSVLHIDPRGHLEAHPDTLT